MYNKTLLVGGTCLAVGFALGIAAEVAYEKWQERKFEEESVEFESDISEEDSETLINAYAADDSSTDYEVAADGIKLAPPEKTYEFKDYSGQYQLDGIDRRDDVSKTAGSVKETYTPEVIDEYEFMNGKPNFQKIEATYEQDSDGEWEFYEDATGQPLSVGSCIGYSALEKFEKDSNGNEIVYVRNEVQGIDYLVMREPYIVRNEE